jgi:hypothetical protein
MTEEITIVEKLAYSILATILFFFTIPGTLMYIPEKRHIVRHAFAHAIVFFITFYFLSRCMYFFWFQMSLDVSATKISPPSVLKK